VLFRTHRLREAADQGAFLGAIRDRVRGIAVYALNGCPAALIEALPGLEIIACFGIGVDLIDIAAVRARGIPVTNTPDVVTEDTADIALALNLAVERRIAEGDRFVRRGDWPNCELRFGRRLGGRKLGIVGLGRIGRAIARRSEAFGMAIAYYGLRRKSELPYRCVDDLVGWK
jgi:lactate dehydrogenase-like 2-hydroxyacid dehydrogenase